MSERLVATTLPLSGSRLIEASAGTGKTWTIAALYVRLVLDHGDLLSAFGRPLTPPQILVMTFTKAATRELVERIRERLVQVARCFRGGAVEPGDDFVKSLLADYPVGAARDQAGWRLATAAESMDDAAVVTIDAWVQRVLREHAFDSGCLFDEELQPDDDAMLDEAVRDYWRREVYPLDRAAQDAVLAIWPDIDALGQDVRRLIGYVTARPEADDSLQALLRAATAGASRLKTAHPLRVDAMRAWLQAHLDETDSPLSKTKFTRKAVTAWLDAVDRWTAEPYAFGIDAERKVVDRLSSAGLRDALKKGRTLEIPAFFDDVPALVDRLRVLPDPAHALRLHAAVRVATRLDELKRGAGLYNFTDMLQRLDTALRGPNGDRLRARVVEQYPVALIDEFQDTSALQFRVFDRLYRTAAHERDTALLLIGDPKQSIYGFRDADIRSYLRARTAVGDRHYVLGTNFRSAKPLVAAVNTLFLAGEARPAGAFRFGVDGEDHALPFTAVRAHGRRECYVDARGPRLALTLALETELLSKDDAQRRLAERCAEHIVATLADPRTGFDDRVTGFVRVRPADITVIVRDRFEAAAVRRALRSRRVPSAYLSDQDSVFASDEARDLLHWLRAVAEPLDARRARVAFATTLIGMPLPDLARVDTDDALFDRRLDVLKTLHVEWRRQGVLPMLRRTLHAFDLPARWMRAKDGPRDGERRLTNVLHLAELLQAASAKLDGEQAVIRWLAGHVEHVGKGDDAQVLRLESDEDLVKVVTIHAAKGLEYPLVYLPFVCTFRDPKWSSNDVVAQMDDEGGYTIAFAPDDAMKARDDLAQRQEEVRLLYVALTRARHALWLGVAPLRFGQGARCRFTDSAFGYLVGGEQELAPDAIGPALHALFDGLPSVGIVNAEAETAKTVLGTTAALLPLRDPPTYTAAFERDWTIGSFSALVRDLSRVPMGAAMVDPAVEEEVLTGPSDEEPAPPSNAARHRFPRGALPGNFLHDQLEWLAAQRFALVGDAALREQLQRRCDRQGWGARANDVVAWLSEIVTTVLPPIGAALHALPRILPEMEFWFPSDGIGALEIDRLCRTHLLDDRPRPALAERTLRGMLMGFADLVFEVDGRYWVLDYKSNALGPGDEAYTRDALAQSMADHRYDVQGAIYLLALHRLLRQRLGDRYDPARHLGGALYLFIRGIEGPEAGCHVVDPHGGWLDALDAAMGAATAVPS